MSDHNIVDNSEGSDHDELINEEVEALHAEIDAIHSDLSSTAERHEDGEEIIAVALEGASAQSAVRINVYENIPFAGGDGDYSILSVLFGLHSIGGGIFSFLTMIDSNKVRVQCVECRQAVMDFPWMDAESRIKGSVKKWRAAFPCARGVNVSCVKISLMQILCTFVAMRVCDSILWTYKVARWSQMQPLCICVGFTHSSLVTATR